MKLQLEIVSENSNLTLKGAATFHLDWKARKHQATVWMYRAAIAALLLWPT